jgi:hypothetical protein
MPINAEINAARLWGAIVRTEADELLLDPDAALLPPQDTTAVARLFS